MSNPPRRRPSRIIVTFLCQRRTGNLGSLPNNRAVKIISTTRIVLLGIYLQTGGQSYLYPHPGVERMKPFAATLHKRCSPPCLLTTSVGSVA